MVNACQQPRTYQVTPNYYYVSPTSTYLRFCPSYG